MLLRSILLAGSAGVSQILLAVLFVYVARMAGVAQLGYIVATIAAATFLAGLTDFGTNNLWVREVTRHGLSNTGLYSRAVSKLIYTLGIGCISVLVTHMIWPDTPYVYVGILAFSMAFFQTSLVPVRIVTRGARLAALTMSERLIAVGAFFALNNTALNAATSLILSLICGSIIAGVMSIAMVPTMYKKVIKLKFTWPWHGSASYGLGGMTLSAQILDTTILQSVAGPVAAGTYGAVNRWTQPLGVFANAFATVGLPVVARSGSIKAAMPELGKAWFILGLAASACVVVAIASPAVVNILLGPEYERSALVLSILALGTVPSLLNQPLYVFLQASRLDKQVSWVVTCTVLFQLASCYMLASNYGALGAAISYAFAQTINLVSFLFILRTTSKQEKRERDNYEGIANFTESPHRRSRDSGAGIGQRMGERRDTH